MTEAEGLIDTETVEGGLRGLSQVHTLHANTRLLAAKAANIIGRHKAEVGDLRAQLQRLTASLEDEREACAALVDTQQTMLIAGAGSEDYWRGVVDGQRASAAAIRSRKEKA